MGEFQVRVDEKPWMVRVVDVAGALSGLPVGCEGRVVVRVQDDLCDWNDGVFDLVVHDGRLRAEPSAAAADVALDIRGLSSLVYGTLDTTELRLRGWLEGDGEVLDRMLPTLPFHNSTPY